MAPNVCCSVKLKLDSFTGQLIKGMISTWFCIDFICALEKAHSYKHHIQTKVVIMLLFSATKSPFAKHFGLEAFFLAFVGTRIFCCAATQGIVLRCTQPLSVFVCALACEGEQAGGKG